MTKVTEKDVGKMATPYGRIRESAAGNTATPARTPQRNRRRDGIEENVVREEEKFDTDVRGFRQPWRSTGSEGDTFEGGGQAHHPAAAEDNAWGIHSREVDDGDEDAPRVPHEGNHILREKLAQKPYEKVKADTGGGEKGWVNKVKVHEKGAGASKGSSSDPDQV